MQATCLSTSLERIGQVHVYRQAEAVQHFIAESIQSMALYQGCEIKKIYY